MRCSVCLILIISYHEPQFLAGHKFSWSLFHAAALLPNSDWRPCTRHVRVIPMIAPNINQGISAHNYQHDLVVRVGVFVSFFSSSHSARARSGSFWQDFADSVTVRGKAHQKAHRHRPVQPYIANASCEASMETPLFLAIPIHIQIGDNIRLVTH